MNAHRAICAALALSGCLVAAALGADVSPPAFPHEGSDLAPDPRVTFGRLENGLRYAILAHPVPPGSVSFRLHVEVGAYQETESELGYAHFVEHMAFNGTRDFPGNQVVQALQQLGANLGGPDANAVTSRFETIYLLNNLPSDQPDDLAAALRIFRNFADGLEFDPNEVVKERGVILSEARSHANAGLTNRWTDELEFLPPLDHDIHVDELEGLFDETRVEYRRPIGTQRAIKKATARSLRAFYDRWYRPERMILTVAGDLEPQAMQQLITVAFASMVARGPITVAPEITPPPAPLPPLPRIFGRQRKHDSREQVTLANTVPRSSRDDEQSRRLALARRLALQMIGARMGRETPHPLMINTWLAHDVPGWELALIRTFVAPEHVTATATLADTEIRRALEYGFSALEVDAAVRGTAVVVAQREADAANSSSAVLAQTLAFSIARGVVFTSPADERALHERALKEIDADECLEALRSLWPVAGTRVLLSGPLPKNPIADGVLRTEINLARAVPVSRPKPQPAPRPFPHTHYGPAGEVVEQRHDAATDCWLVTFANGVRLNFKRTAHEREWVRLQVRFGHGHLGAPADRPLLPWGIFALVHAGMKDVANDELSSPLLGLSFDKYSSLNLDSFAWGADLPSRDFTRGMHYAAAVLRHTDWANAPETIVRSTLSTIFTSGEHTARGVAESQFRHAQVNVAGLFLGNTKEAARFPLQSATDWIQTQLSDCPIEITVVGDVERDAVITAIAHTFGAFSARQPLMSRDDPRRAAAWPTPGVREVRFEGNKGLGAVIIGWTVSDAAGRADDAALSLLTEIIGDRLSAHVREKLGLTYSPHAYLVSHHEVQPRRIVLQCYLEAAPRQLARVTDAARSIVAAVARDGVTADELERARRPLLRQWNSNQRSNSWWLHQLARAQSDPESVEGIADFQAALEASTLDEINTLARTLLDLNKAHQISALPK